MKDEPDSHPRTLTPRRGKDGEGSPAEAATCGVAGGSFARPAHAGPFAQDDGSERVSSGFKCGCLKGMNFNGSPV